MKIYKYVCLILIMSMLLASGCGKKREEDVFVPDDQSWKEEMDALESGGDEQPEPEGILPEVIDGIYTIGKETIMNDKEKYFYIEEIDDAHFERMRGKSFKDDCTLPREDLRCVHVCHVGFDKETHRGEMVVNKYIAQDVLEIFTKLYEAEYPIEKVVLVDEYDAVDESSMADNNSSAFNFRFISYTTTVSKHGLGLAVDINPLYNPYVKTVNGKLSVEPANGVDYVDRSKDFPYKIDENDLCYKLFLEHGFEWGGSWSGSKDYQHFEIPTKKCKELYP